MGIIEKFYGFFQRKHISSANEKTSKIESIKINNYAESAEIEANILKGLKEVIYKQDTNEINRLLSSLASLGSSQTTVNNMVSDLKYRIRGTSFSSRKRDKINKLVKELETLSKKFNDLSSRIRTRMEGIKSSIKANDFNWAEQQINSAISFEKEIGKTGRDITNKIDEITTNASTP